MAWLNREVISARSSLQVKEIVTKVNTGPGQPGKAGERSTPLPGYRRNHGQVRKFVTDLEKGKGLVGTFVNDPAFRDQAVKTMAELQATFANLNKTTADLREAAARLPDMAKRLESFVVNLERAGKGLPGLVTEGQTLFGDARTRRPRPPRGTGCCAATCTQPQEHTIRLDAEPGKD